ncbi:hypothetical protein AMATHDRAFT_7186 [Amanita thiersii Skay4041]|uniref:DUF6535 domain-containing protein n=1 Tax=Amanita thiersii Skay4041 TaxID=703135 RepID=A0A2A9NH05_9AGAR|nr:hypothetical protein AMATHDRAFT_7186 [Amanita thiersii Skay4041]
MPQFWTQLKFPVHKLPLPVGALTSFCDMWIQRSSGLPLQIKVYSHPDTFNDLHVQELMRILVKNLDRLESLDVACSDESLSLSRKHIVAPKLRVFKVLQHGGRAREMQFPFDSCPALMELAWPNTHSLIAKRICIPWRQLTYLELDYVSLHQITHLFQYCTRLVCAQVAIMEMGIPLGSRAQPFQRRLILPEMERLETKVARNCQIDVLFDSILVPKLSSIRVEQVQCRFGEGESVHAPVLSASCLRGMLVLSNCELLHLDLVHLNYDSERLLSILEVSSCYSLETLELTADVHLGTQDLSDELLRHLSFRNLPVALCPNLKKMVLIDYDSSIPGALARMVASRFECGNSCFEEFRFWSVASSLHAICDAWKDEIEKLLIFAALFSATVTAFTVESYRWLLEDYAQTSALLLAQLSFQVNASANNVNVTLLVPQNQAPFTPDPRSVRINITWFLSLVLCLSTVVVGILCFQWLREFSQERPLSSEEAVMDRQMRYEGLLAWKVPEVISTLPVVLQLSVFLFFAGILDLLWSLHHIVAAFITTGMGITMSVIAVTTCPYKSPLSWFFAKFMNTPFHFPLFTIATPKHAFIRGKYPTIHSFGAASWLERDDRLRSLRIEFKEFEDVNGYHHAYASTGTGRLDVLAAAFRWTMSMNVSINRTTHF